MKTEDAVQAFINDLVELCKKHEARIFSRKDSVDQYVSVELGPYSDCALLDFKRIDEDGAEMNHLGKRWRMP